MLPGVLALVVMTIGVALAWPEPRQLEAVPEASSTDRVDLSGRSGDSSRQVTRPAPAPSVVETNSASPSPSSSSFSSSSVPAQGGSKSEQQKSAEEESAKKGPAKTKTAVRYATASLNIRSGPSMSARVVGVLAVGSKLTVTGTTSHGWTQVLINGQHRWVSSDFLTSTKPKKTTSSNGLSGKPCRSGSAVESGLTPDAIAVHRAICARFPQITSYGGVRPDSLPEHPSGRALDAMVANQDLGWQIAKFVKANHRALGVSQVIYDQQIWTVQRSGEGWRPMSDRGSATANHENHVHVTVYGHAAA